MHGITALPKTNMHTDCFGDYSSLDLGWPDYAIQFCLKKDETTVCQG